MHTPMRLRNQNFQIQFSPPLCTNLTCYSKFDYLSTVVQQLLYNGPVSSTVLYCILKNGKFNSIFFPNFWQRQTSEMNRQGIFRKPGGAPIINFYQLAPGPLISNIYPNENI